MHSLAKKPKKICLLSFENLFALYALTTIELLSVSPFQIFKGIQYGFAFRESDKNSYTCW